MQKPLYIHACKENRIVTQLKLKLSWLYHVTALILRDNSKETEEWLQSTRSTERTFHNIEFPVAREEAGG